MSDKRNVLRWVNQQLLTHKLGDPLDDLPRGRRGAPSACVIARAFGDACADPIEVLIYAEEDDSPIVVKCPPFVSRFINDFDNGEYPELVAA